jgi:GTP-binding protein
MIRDDIRNIAIIAHVDHGKTTMVDSLLRQSGLFRDSQLQGDCILDSNDLERERGITILAKNIALTYQPPGTDKIVKINLIDTPGHADFGGEVERIVRMADGCLLLVDAFDGPMPQTKFVLKKAFEAGLHPIVVVNKIDRPDARPKEVLNLCYDLFIDLGASDVQVEFPYIFASGKEGWATFDPAVKGENIQPIFDLILKHVPGPDVEVDGPLRLQVSSLQWSEYVGRIGVGRIKSGSISVGQNVVLMKESTRVNHQVEKLYEFDKLGKVEVKTASAGDVVAVVGLEDCEIGDTISSLEDPGALPRLTVEEPTLTMIFTINDSPLAGRDGEFLTSRHLRERLMRELDSNVALRVEEGESKEQFLVSGRGLLHLGVLIETMRREGYELSVGKPQVIYKDINGEKCEPYELLLVEVPSDRLGPVMEMAGARRGELLRIESRGTQTTAEFVIPARGLIGMKTRLLNATAGEVIMHHVFHEYRPMKGDIPRRPNGVMIANQSGKANAYALDGLQERGEMFVAPGQDVYEGMVIAEHCRDNDLTVNPCKEKKLTNIRASGADKSIILKPPREMSLEIALEYIEDDEFVEVTPKVIRLRKRYLSEEARKKATRNKAG